MIYYNSNLNSLPDALQLRTLLTSIQNRMPVQHLMPTERVMDDESKYILTHLSNGCFSLKPNITHQGVLYYGNSNFENVKGGLFSQYFMKDKTNKSRHEDFVKYNVLLEQFKLLIKTFPLYDLLSQGIDVDNSNVKFVMKNSYGLASAYSFVSPYINLTSSLDLAMFYATHKYTKEGYIPADTDTLGIIYVYNLNEPFGLMRGLSTLGLQVFMKTFNTKQFLYRLKSGEDFNTKPNVIGFTFRQTNAVADYYAQVISEKEILPTNDFLETKLKTIQYKVFSKAIEENLRKNRIDSEAVNRSILQKAGFEIEEGTPSFTVEDLIGVDLEEIWTTIMGQTLGISPDDQKTLSFLRRVPSLEKYKKYFNIVKYYEER